MCDVSGSDYDSTEIAKTRIKARTAKRCCECNFGIKPGEEYEKYAGTCEGSFFYEHTCGACAEARDEYLKRHPGAGYLFGELEHDVKHCLREEPASEEWIAKRWHITKEIEDGDVVGVELEIKKTALP